MLLGMKLDKFFLLKNTEELYLFKKVAAELNISGRFVRNRHGDDVAHSLYLVDDSINIRKVFPVFYRDLSVSHNLAELLLDLV